MKKLKRLLNNVIKEKKEPHKYIDEYSINEFPLIKAITDVREENEIKKKNSKKIDLVNVLSKVFFGILLLSVVSKKKN